MSDRPNILWYCSDQQRFDTIAALGNPHIHTPRLDRFMAGATTFTHAYCQSPICTPSRASFLTGMYPSALGVNANGNAYFPRHHEGRLVSHVLARNGFDCGLVGKLHLAGSTRGRELRVDDGYRLVSDALVELLDLDNDPWEHRDLSSDPDHRETRWQLMRRSFDATVYSHLPGPPRAMPA